MLNKQTWKGRRVRRLVLGGQTTATGFCSITSKAQIKTRRRQLHIIVPYHSHRLYHPSTTVDVSWLKSHSSLECGTDAFFHSPIRHLILIIIVKYHLQQHQQHNKKKRLLFAWNLMRLLILNWLFSILFLLFCFSFWVLIDSEGDGCNGTGPIAAMALEGASSMSPLPTPPPSPPLSPSHIPLPKDYAEFKLSLRSLLAHTMIHRPGKVHGDFSGMQKDSVVAFLSLSLLTFPSLSISLPLSLTLFLPKHASLTSSKWTLLSLKKTKTDWLRLIG